MNDDDRLLLDVRSWLKDEDVVLPDAEQAGRLVAAGLPQTRQLRRRWWPLPSFKGTSLPPRVMPDTEYQATPIPATNGHSPTVTGRTKSMFSPVKAITAGALVSALGGVLLIAQPFDQQGGSVPGAETDTEAVPAAWVTGNIAYASSCSGPTSESDGDVRRERDYVCTPQTWTTSDPRLTGKVASTWNADVYTVDEGRKSVITGAYYMSNEGGGWACRSNGLQHGGGLLQPWENDETAMCVGEGGYDGLSAILVIGGPAGPRSIVGLIFSGEAPPLPEPPASE